MGDSDYIDKYTVLGATNTNVTTHTNTMPIFSFPLMSPKKSLITFSASIPYELILKLSLMFNILNMNTIMNSKLLTRHLNVNILDGQLIYLY